VRLIGQAPHLACGVGAAVEVNGLAADVAGTWKGQKFDEISHIVRTSWTLVV